MTASVIPFPPRRVTPSELGELLRWSAEADAVAGWSVWQAPDTGALVARGDTGAEFVSLMQGQSWDGCAYTVTLWDGRWEVADGRGTVVGTFASLRDALETVCRTIRNAA